ncbi:hypothetical protein [Spirosoma gilvum]
MNTEQNYVGKGDSATTLPQMAQNEGQTSSTVDNRLNSFKPMDVDQSLSEAQTSLLELVGAYMDCQSPIESINELLRVWLSNPSVDLGNLQNKRHLNQMLDLVNFLVAMKEANDTVMVLDQASMRTERLEATV